MTSPLEAVAEGSREGERKRIVDAMRQWAKGAGETAANTAIFLADRIEAKELG